MGSKVGQMDRKKVLIVEDELLARIGLHQLVNWELMNLELLEDAKDGQEALDRIRENCPDIIILDLNIPKINGLQVLEYINENGLSCSTIVVSCNEEFEMVKDAMKLGAFDYLRKLNLSAEEITGILKKCLEKITGGESDAEVRSDTKRRNHEQKFRQEIQYEAIISGSGNSLFHYADIYCTVLCILNQKQSIDGNIYRTATYVKKEFDRNQLDYIQIVKGNQYCYFLFTKRFTDDWYYQLHNQIENHDREKCYFGIYESDMQDNSKINEGISMAEQVIYFSFYDEEQQIHRIWKKLPCSEHSPKLIHSAITVLRNEVDQFHREESVRTIRQIIEIISVEKYTHINVLRRIFMDILCIYSMTAQTLNSSIEEIAVYGDNCHYQKIMMMNSLQMVEQWLIEFENVFFKYFWIRYKCSQSDILRQAIEYINNHLYGHLQLTEAANCIGVSNSYLSTVFKKEIGQSFVDYVNKKKIEVGKEMLKQGKLVYEVSDILGFENCTYFSKVFKKYHGISPDSYRKEQCR